MNTNRPTSDPAAEEQASLWAARLEGGVLEASDRAALDAWLAAKPAHRALLSDYCQFSADLEHQLPALVSSGAVQMPVAPRRSRWSVSWLSLGTGTLAAAAAVALGLWIAQPTTQKTEVLSSSVAQLKAFTLSDGTRVELNAQTSLLVEHTGDERRVRLASGEAYFAVAKDPSRPFIVETPTGSVRVTGTVFSVRTDKTSELEVTVAEGSVQVRPSDTDGTGPRPPSALTGGTNNHLVAKSGSGVTVRTLTANGVEDALAWRQGQIVTNNIPLRAALARFAQYNGRGITVSPGAEKLSVGSRYSLKDLQRFLDEVQQIHPVRITHDPSGIIHVSLRSEP